MAKKKTKRSKARKTEPAVWGITAAVMAVVCLAGFFLPHRAIVLLSGGLGVLSVVAVVAAFKWRETRIAACISE